MMKRFGIAAIALLAATAGAWAQSDTITVSAQNRGVLELSFSSATFDFGQVDADGATSSTGVSGARNGADDGATYTQAAAATWTVRSAPPRTVRLYNDSTTSSIVWGTADRLRLEVPGSNSCGALDFSSTGDSGSHACGSGVLVHSVSAGNGSNAATGDLNLELDVMDVDVTGTNSWTVVVTTVGS